MYAFDIFGWLSETLIPTRCTSVEPPAHGAKEVGQPYPNWTGMAWTMANYFEPPAPPMPALPPQFDPVASGAARLKRQAAKIAKTDPVAAILKLQLEG